MELVPFTLQLLDDVRAGVDGRRDVELGSWEATTAGSEVSCSVKVESRISF